MHIRTFSALVALGAARCGSGALQRRLAQGQGENFIGSDAFDTVELSFKPKWTRESLSAGAPSKKCGVIKDESKLPDCDVKDIQRFQALSKVFTDDPGNISGVVSNVVLVGDNPDQDLKSCVVPGSDPPEGSHRLFVSSQYSNEPRCCNADEADGLCRSDDSLHPWTLAAIDSLEKRSNGNIEYYYRQPTNGACTKTAPCPLVMQLGAQDEAWFSLQSKCSVCSKLLGSALLNPLLPEDLGKRMGSSNRVLLTGLVPLVEQLLMDNPELDPARVYIVSLSQGNDMALRASLLRPDLFSAVVMSGKFEISSETNDMLIDIQDGVAPVRSEPSRLTSISVNLGDLDHVYDDESFYSDLYRILDIMKVGTEQRPRLRVDIRIYPDAHHTVWWAVWNEMHDMLWSGKRDPFMTRDIPISCKGGQAR